MLGRRLNPSLRERFTIVVAAAAFAFVARTASEALGASIPDGLYEALSEAPDVAAAGLDATLAGSLVLATSFAALGATTNEAALRALATNREIVLCAQEQKMPPLTYARRLYSKNVTLADGTSIVTFEGGCEDGNDNDAIYIFGARGSQPYKLVSKEFGFLEKLAPDGTLVLMSNPGGTNVRYHDTERWNGATFTHASSIMVWMNTGESKPASVPFAFAAGASSATVSGTVRRDFPDVYQFDARAGQTLSVDVRPRSGRIGRLAIEVAGGSDVITFGRALSWHGKLPPATHAVRLADGRVDDAPGGHYTITVDGADDNRATYAMTVSIR
jgi:hypothetical protein